MTPSGEDGMRSNVIAYGAPLPRCDERRAAALDLGPNGDVQRTVSSGSERSLACVGNGDSNRLRQQRCVALFRRPDALREQSLPLFSCMSSRAVPPPTVQSRALGAHCHQSILARGLVSMVLSCELAQDLSVGMPLDVKDTIDKWCRGQIRQISDE